jgi:hypothetical protein
MAFTELPPPPPPPNIVRFDRDGKPKKAQVEYETRLSQWLGRGAGYRKLDDYKLSTDADDTEAFQRAHDDTNNDGIILLPARELTISGQVEITRSLRWVGCGWNETHLYGTIINLTGTVDSPFYIAGTDAQGTVFENFSVRQSHPTPGGGWAPTAYPAVFDIFNVNGEVRINNILAAPVYDLVKSRGSQRMIVENIRGQIFRRAVDVDGAYDVCRFVNFQIWPYWSQNQNVWMWQQSNSDVLYIGRCDTPFIDKIFVIFARSLIHTVTTAAGDPTKLYCGALCADATKYGLLIESDNFTADIASLLVQSADYTATTATIPGGRAMLLSGDNARVRIQGLQTERHESIVIEVAGDNCLLYVGHAHFRYIDSAVGVVEVTGSASVVSFDTAPYIEDAGSAGIANTGTQVLVGMRQNYVASQVNEVRAFGAATGSAVELAAIGVDTNINLQLSAKGSGAVKAATASVLDNSTTVATTAYVDRASPQGAWTSYTPTIAPQTGAFTSASATGSYRQVGKTVYVYANITITTNGTGSGFITFTLPVSSPTASTVGCGREINSTGVALSVTFTASASTASIVKYDNTYPGADGYVLTVSGIYEIP